MVIDDSPPPTSRRRHIARLVRVLRVSYRDVLSGCRRAGHRLRGGAPHDCRDGPAGAADVRRGVGRSRRVVCPGRDPGRGQRDAVRSGVGHLGDAGLGGGHRDRRKPHRPSGGPGQRAGPAGEHARRPHRRGDRTRRPVGGGRPAVRSRNIGRAGFLRVRRVRSSVVADGRRFVRRLGAAGVRLHRAGRIDPEPFGAAGVRGDSGVVRQRHRRRVCCAAWIQEMAWARAPYRRCS